MESKLEASKLFECNLPNEIWCEVFSYLDEKSLKNITTTCKLWFGIIRGVEKFSGHVKMKFTDLEDLFKEIKTSEWLMERWPSMTVLEVSLGNLVARHHKKLYEMTKLMELIPLGLRGNRFTTKVGSPSRYFLPTNSNAPRSRFFVPSTSNAPRYVLLPIHNWLHYSVCLPIIFRTQYQNGVCLYHGAIKVWTFWERHKIWKNLPLLNDHLECNAYGE